MTDGSPRLRRNAQRSGAQQRSVRQRDAWQRPSRWPGWLWLLVGALLLPFTAFQTVLPVAAWLAPVFILRFVRTARRGWVAWGFVVLTYTAAYTVSFRNGFVPFGLPMLFGGALFYALVHSLPYVADRTLAGGDLGQLGVIARTLPFPLAAVTVDWVMSLFNPFATYGSPAYSQATVLPLVQLVAVTGLWGLTFLVAWCAPVLNGWWEAWEGVADPTQHEPSAEGQEGSAAPQDPAPPRDPVWQGRRVWRDWRDSSSWHHNHSLLLLFAGVVFVTVLLGSARLALVPPTTPTVRVAALTPDRSLWEKAAYDVAWDQIGRAPDTERAAFRARFTPFLDDLFARTRREARAGARIIVWSEGAAFVLEEDKAAVLGRAQELARREGVYLEMGMGIFRRTDEPPFIRNQAILVDPDGEVVWEYDKAKPVPGESPMISAGPGVMPTVDTPYGRLGTAICYDLDYPALLRQAGQAGVDLLLVPANDFEPHRFTHAQMATFRAVENGCALVRPASLGLLLATDGQGQVLGRVDYFRTPRATLVAEVPVRARAGTGTPLYPWIGDLFAYLCLAGLVAIAWLEARRSPRPRQPDPVAR